MALNLGDWCEACYRQDHPTRMVRAVCPDCPAETERELCDRCVADNEPRLMIAGADA